jgi:hypothetical protein
MSSQLRAAVDGRVASEARGASRIDDRQLAITSSRH